MTTVVHLITDLNVGGAERQLCGLVAQSDRHYFRHLVVSMTDVGPLAPRLAGAGIETHVLRMKPGVPSPAALIKLVKLLRNLKPNILQCWMYHANQLGLLAAKLAGVPRVVWGIRCSDMDFSRYRPLTRWVFRVGARLSRLPDRIVINSEAGRKLHEQWGYDGSKMIIIPNGFDLDVFKPDPEARRSVRRELGVSHDTVLIGLIARFDPMKDHATFLKAAGLLIQRERGVRFLLVGPGITGAHPDLFEMIRANCLDGLVRLLGFRDDISRLTAALDIACLSSSSEGFPNAVGEAMACGVPCVVTDAGDAAYLVGDTGRVVPRRDAPALAAALSELIAMCPSDRQLLGRRARRRVEGNFTWAKMVGAYESLYQRMLNEEGTVRPEGDT